MTAAPRELHTFDVFDEIKARTARGLTDPSAIAADVLAAIPAGESDRVLAHAVYLLAKAAIRTQPRTSRPRTSSTPRPTPPAASPKVTAIRDEWRQRLTSFDFSGYRGRPTTLLAATPADLMAAAQDRAAASQLAAQQAAFLRGVAKAVRDAGVDCVEGLPVQMQRAIAERIPS